MRLGSNDGADEIVDSCISSTAIDKFIRAVDFDPRQSGDPGQKSISPAMNFSTLSRASSSGYCTGGDFMKYDDADSTGPPTPRSLAILAARTASMITPAEFGESHTSSLYSRLSGTSPNARPSRRT